MNLNCIPSSSCIFVVYLQHGNNNNQNEMKYIEPRLGEKETLQSSCVFIGLIVSFPLIYYYTQNWITRFSQCKKEEEENYRGKEI